jgi:hypothetical protein
LILPEKLCDPPFATPNPLKGALRALFLFLSCSKLLNLSFDNESYKVMDEILKCIADLEPPLGPFRGQGVNDKE